MDSINLNKKDLIPRLVSNDRHLERAIHEIVRSIKAVNYGSVEIVIQNSRVVQIERKEKLRFDRD